MTYNETCEYLYKQTPMFERQGASGYKEGLDNSQILDEHFGHPHRNYRCIHIAGTNGKGSCSHTISAILQSCGYKVGLYTSPHLVDFSERIRINGQPIEEDYVVNFVEEEKDFFTPLSPSFFEVTTAMAFKYFADKKVDIAVIEVGLGGRLDCTNIITPMLSVITNISFDHTGFLGDTLALIASEKAGIIKHGVPVAVVEVGLGGRLDCTNIIHPILSVITNIGFDHTQFLGTSLEQIAMEKAGIIKRGVPVIIGEAVPETRPIFEAIAKDENAPITFAEDNPEIKAYSQSDNGLLYNTVSFGQLNSELGGIYQAKNANTILHAVKALETLDFMFPCPCDENTPCMNKEVREGFGRVCELTGLRGRWETVSASPLTVCDTGHNVEGWRYLSEQLKSVKCQRMHIVFGMVEDKDVQGVIELLPENAIYYFTKSSSERSLSENVIKIYATQRGLHGESYPNVSTAYEAAKNNASNDDFVFIGGSSYIVADFLKKCI